MMTGMMKSALQSWREDGTTADGREKLLSMRRIPIDAHTLVDLCVCV